MAGTNENDTAKTELIVKIDPCNRISVIFTSAPASSSEGTTEGSASERKRDGDNSCLNNVRLLHGRLNSGLRTEEPEEAWQGCETDLR